jgi:hypothetical protein
MKMAYLTIITMALAFVFSGCSDPCEKAASKAKECHEKSGKKVGAAEEPLFLQICKTNKSKFKKCLDIKDCKKYSECIAKAGTDPKAVTALEKEKAEAEVDTDTPQPAEKPVAPKAKTPVKAMAAPVDTKKVDMK